jgi:hypothetical protein
MNRTIPKSRVSFAVVLLFVWSETSVADYTDEFIHYKCDRSGDRVLLWTEDIPGDIHGRNTALEFDRRDEGFYDPSRLAGDGRGPGRVIRKVCKIGGDSVGVIIGAQRACQMGYTLSLRVSYRGKLIFRADPFGSDCSDIWAPHYLRIEPTLGRITVGPSGDNPESEEENVGRVTFGLPIE